MMNISYLVCASLLVLPSAGFAQTIQQVPFDSRPNQEIDVIVAPNAKDGPQIRDKSTDEVEYILGGVQLLVDILVDRKDEVISAASGTARREIEQVLDEYVATRQGILRDNADVDSLPKTQQEIASKILGDQAVQLRTEAEEKATKWVQDNLTESQLDDILHMIFRGGMSAVRVPIAASHLNLTEDQRSDLQKLVEEELTFKRTVFLRHGVDGLMNPTKDLQMKYVLFLCQCFDVLNEDQLKKFLVIRGKIKSGQSVVDWLAGLPDQVRTDFLNRSRNLKRIWSSQIGEHTARRSTPSS